MNAINEISLLIDKTNGRLMIIAKTFINIFSKTLFFISKVDIKITPKVHI